jgi:CubicO group peptidase (beta-lactamase class C family)
VKPLGTDSSKTGSEQFLSPSDDLLRCKKMITAFRVICFTTLLSALSFRAAAEDFTNAIHAYLQQYVEAEKINVGIVVGIVDEHGSSIVSYGKMDNGTGQEVNGDTLFEIASITKTFTALLLQDMLERGEMKLDDPVAKYLPKSVKMPTHNGKEITLLHLATHTSGLPNVPEFDIDPKRADNAYAEYTVENLYAFVSGYQLIRDPGTKYKYSGVGMALLGQAIALKAGTNYESVVVDRICRPLKMDSTRITLTPELNSRFATGYNQFGNPQPRIDLPALAGADALRSTANDMLKYLSANLGLTPSSLTPLMEKTHVAHFNMTTHSQIGLAWVIRHNLQGAKLVLHGGGTLGFITFAALDMTRRRGVVVLSNSEDQYVPAIGYFLLESEWQSDQRPKEKKNNSEVYGSYVGQYQVLPDVAPQMSSNVIGRPSQPAIGIRREGDRLFAQATGSSSWPVNAILPPGAGELSPESETRFFERLSGMPATFSRDDRGKVAGLTMHYQGNAFFYEKISDQPAEALDALDSPKPHIPIKLDPKLLDACVSKYEFATNTVFPAGMKLAIWRKRGRLIGQYWGKNVPPGAFDIYPESETNFFIKFNGAQLTFIKNAKGEVTAVIHHLARLPDSEGKKLKN